MRFFNATGAKDAIQSLTRSRLRLVNALAGQVCFEDNA